MQFRRRRSRRRCSGRTRGSRENPRAWLTQVAFRRMADHIRSESARRRREGEAALDAAPTTESTAIETATPEDDTLVLLFMCCHSALTPASAIALTLRAVGGLTTAEIAHAFLVHDTGYRLVEVAAFPRSRPAISRTWNFAHNRGSAIESCLAACGIDA